MLTSKRQSEAFIRARKELLLAFVPLHDLSLELFSFHINACIQHLDDITQPFSHSEVLDELFSSFCLGK